MKKNNFKNGFTLVEILLALAIVSFISIASFLIYSKVKIQSDSSDVFMVLEDVKSNIKELYSSKNYKNGEINLSDAEKNFIFSRYFPKGIDKNNDVYSRKNYFINVITVQSIDNMIQTTQYLAVPREVCPYVIEKLINDGDYLFSSNNQQYYKKDGNAYNYTQKSVSDAGKLTLGPKVYNDICSTNVSSNYSVIMFSSFT